MFIHVCVFEWAQNIRKKKEMLVWLRCFELHVQKAFIVTVFGLDLRLLLYSIISNT